jgi:hypothetical protein
MLKVEVLVLRERVRGLEALVDTLQRALETNSQMGLATAQAARGLGFRVLGPATMASAEADDPNEQEPAPVVKPEIIWFGTGTAAADAAPPAPITTSEA